MPHGLDVDCTCEHYAGAFQKAQIEFVCRYYCYSRSKRLTVTEAQALSKVGIKLVAIWETSPTDASYFSYSKGVDDGTSAYQQALTLGQPKDSVIYFAVDYDAGSPEISGQIGKYFEGVAAGFSTISQSGGIYAIGVYGSGATCSWMLKNGQVTYTWLAQSRGWLGSSEFHDWNIRQAGEGTIGGLAVDLDEATEDYGGFMIS